jgi:hypothetical protein
LASINKLSVATLRGWLFAAGIAGPKLVIQIQGFSVLNDATAYPDEQVIFACPGAGIKGAKIIPSGTRCQ